LGGTTHELRATRPPDPSLTLGFAASVILNGEAREESQTAHPEILRALRRSG
jgi:hypothetical protein